MNIDRLLPPRSLLYLPASNARAIDKVRGLPVDMVLLDLEDAVKPDAKDVARHAAIAAVNAGFGDKLTAIRINGPQTPWHDADMQAVAASKVQFVVVPKIDSAVIAQEIANKTNKPLLAMIETPAGVLNASSIAASDGVAGLIAGTNDLANDLKIPPGCGRAGLALSLQSIMLASRAARIWAFDGVFNDLDNRSGLEAECLQGRAFGFDGKTLIHPGQIDIANRIWSPNRAELEEARALIAAASGGAERFRDRMIETMHVEMAQRMLARAEAL